MMTLRVVRGMRRRARLFVLLVAGVGALIACSGSELSEGGESLGVSADALTTAQVWSMDTAANWTVVAGTGTRVASTQRTEGSASLQLTAPGYVAVRGAVVDKPGFVSPVLAFDMMVPPQAGPNYFGAIQVSLNAPSLGIFSQWLSPPRDLNAPTGVWQTHYFQIPSALYGPILSSPFNDLQVTIGVNPAINQPYRLDNLRFVPVPSCVGVPNGTLCDDSVTCTTGNTCNAEVCGVPNPVPPGSSCDVGDDVLGFENTPAWQTTNGSATLAPSTTRVQGQRSLSVTPRNGVTVGSIALKTLHKVSQTLSLRVQKPTHQPNAGWHGDLSLTMSSPSRGVNFTQTVALTGQPNGTFFELIFPVAAATYQTLATSTYTDLKFSISINPPFGQTGFYLFDDLHFVPVTSCAGALANTACDDGSLCTQGDACSSAGVCGVPVVCNDNNGCTDDSCNPAVGCLTTPNVAPCTDGNACTNGDRCANGFCFPGPPLACDDGNGCTDDGCNTLTGCTHANNTASCTDSNACTTGDQCSGGACVSSGPLPCDDGNICTDDSCDPATGCTYANNSLSCSDGSVCTLVDQCQNGTCVGASPRDCSDGNGCTTDFCVAGVGCMHAPGCAGTCFENACCFPKTCEDLFAECGVHDDGCGGTVDCSASCPTDGSCNPAGRCLPPNQFREPTGIDVCEILLNDLIIRTPIEVDFFECIATLDFSDPLQCAWGVFSGHFDCCLNLGDCLDDPVCRAARTVTEFVETTLAAGTPYCTERSPFDYLEKVANGSISNLEEWGLFLSTGGLTGLIEWDIALLSNVGRQAPDHVRNLIRALVAPVYDGGETGFTHEDLDSVKIVSSAVPTAGFYLPGARSAITLGPVIVMKDWLYNALFSASFAGVSYEDFLLDDAVCSRYMAAVDVLIHELVHVKQARELGRVNFYTQYLGSALVNEYGEIRFEDEAFDYHIGLSELQGGRYCSVTANFHNDFITDLSVDTPMNTCPGIGPPVLNQEFFPGCP